MKLFIGWSGARSQALAQALRDWVPLILHYVEPWVSEKDIAAGERWAKAVGEELEASNFGVVCVTRDNVASPWILFEAGSLAKSLENSRLIPLLLDLDLSEIAGPLAQFQAKKVDKDGLREVVQSINQLAAQPVLEARAEQLLDALWPQLENQIAAIPKQPGSVKTTRPQHEILEELVSGVRSLETRLRNVEEGIAADGSRSGSSRRYPRLHPMMLDEVAHMVGEKPDDPISILVVASMLREPVPWLYELGIDAYRAIRNGTPEEGKEAFQRFYRAAEFLLHTPLFEEYGLDQKMLHMTLRGLRHLEMAQAERAVTDTPAPPKRRRAPGPDDPNPGLSK